MDLTDVLAKSEYASLSNEDALAALLQTVIAPQSSVLYTMSGVGQAFAEAELDVSILFDIGGFIKSLLGGPSLYDFLMSSGKCDFTIAGIQQQLAYNAQIESGNPARLAAVNVLIGLGAPKPTPTWQVEGLASEPTLEEIASVRAVSLERQRIAHFVNEVLQQAISEGKTVAEIQALAADSANW